jgi:hypothetical protein
MTLSPSPPLSPSSTLSMYCAGGKPRGVRSKDLVCYAYASYSARKLARPTCHSLPLRRTAGMLLRRCCDSCSCRCSPLSLSCCSLAAPAPLPPLVLLALPGAPGAPLHVLLGGLLLAFPLIGAPPASSCCSCSCSCCCCCCSARPGHQLLPRAKPCESISRRVAAAGLALPAEPSIHGPALRA